MLRSRAIRRAKNSFQSRSIYRRITKKKKKRKGKKKEERKKKIILFEIAEKSKEERLKFEIDRAENAATLVLESACSLTR